MTFEIYMYILAAGTAVFLYYFSKFLQELGARKYAKQIRNASQASYLREEAEGINAYIAMLEGCTISAIAIELGDNNTAAYRRMKEVHYQLTGYVWHLKFMREDKDIFEEIAHARLGEIRLALEYITP